MKKLGFGMMRLPLADPNDQSRPELDQVCRMVDTFLERGFTYFDTAYMYHEHQSERVVKQALVDRYPRERFLLADKMPMMELTGGTPADQERIFNEQLEKCGVDYFDYYLLHSLQSSHYETAQRLDSFAFLQRKRAEGKARHIGFSYHDSAALLDQILTEHPEVEFVQLQLNYLDWETESIQSRLCYETAVRHGKKVVVMEPVKGGRLARLPQAAEALLKSCHPDWSPASWALRFAAGLSEVLVVLSGMSDLEQLEDNTASLDGAAPLTPAERAVLDQALEQIKAATKISCTACRYCVEGCPQHIAIPEYFEQYNIEKQVGRADRGVSLSCYNSLILSHGKASECVACGQCESVCPQHIPIIDWLKKVAETFEG